MAADSNETTGDYSAEGDDNSPELEPNDLEATNLEAGEGAAADVEEDAEVTIESLTAALLVAQDAASAAKDQALRAMAEGENVKRRATKDVQNAHKFALDKFVADLLPVVDSLDKAVDAAAALASDSADGSADAFSEGVALSLKLALDTLKKHGVEQLNPLGEPFNPQQHEAMAMVPNPDAEPNSVMDVMQPGYELNGRLVRAAMVVVAKAPE